MSAFGGKADMTLCRNPLSRSLLGAKRTCLFALHMTQSGHGLPKTDPFRAPVRIVTIACLSLGGDDNEATRLYQNCRLSGRMATWGARATAGTYAARRRAHEFRGKRSGSAGAPDGIPASTATVGLDERPQRADRHSLECRRF